KMLDKAISLNCTVKVTLDDGAVHDKLVIPITILPATIMYYETDFLTDPNSVIFSTEAKPLTEEDKYLWSTRESDGKDDLQDSGEAGDIVYKPVIDKESIPSNAFFVDFDGEGYRDRYSVDPLYNGHDFDSGNWIARYVENPYVNSGNTLSFPYSASCTYNVSEGTMSLPVTNSYSANSEDITGNTSRIYGPEFHTGTKTDSYSIDTLQYKYSVGDYAELRFKTEGCVFDRAKNTSISRPIAVLRLRYLVYDENGKQTLSETLVHTPFTFNDGVYQTVSFTIPPELEKETIITIGVRFQHIRQADENVPGSIVVDYLYVGPETGWAESVNSSYLYFGFGNTDADRLRYSTAAYGRNFDQPTDAYWATANNGGSKKYTIDNSQGVITFPVLETSDSLGKFGPNLMTTAISGSYPQSGQIPIAEHSPLRFDARSAEYVQIRFKLDNCEWSDDTLRKLLFLYCYEENGVEKYVSDDIKADYSLANGKYQTIRIPIPAEAKLRSADTLTAFGLRFRGIKSIAGQNGTVTIDELFIGSYEALTRLDEGEDFLFFDFTDTDADKVRYSGSTYGGINFGTENWVGTYSWDNELYDPATIENGVLSIPRSQAYDYTYAQSGGSESSRCFRYNPEKAEIFAVRFKMDNTLSVTSKSRIRLDYLTESANGDYVKAAEAYLNTETGAYDNYKTVIIDITNEAFLAANLIRSIRVDFWYLEGVGSIHIDSIYVGPKAVSNPAADSVYIGFDNMAADLDRYDSDTYNYLNPDDEKTVRWHYNRQKTSSVTVDNKEGTAQVIAVPLAVREQNKVIDDVFQWPDIYIASSSTGDYSKEYFDYKPQNAEIYQIRFRMKNFQPALNESKKSITPYGKLFWLVSGSDSPEEVVTASETIYLTPSQYSGDIWVTLTAKIPEECRNENSIVGIRPYFGGLKSSDNAQGEIVIDYIYIGPDDRPDQVYGYDSHYNNDTTLSDGSSFFVNGSGVKLNEASTTYTEASFNFKGTGFDIISRTGPEQATIRVEVTHIKKDENGNVVYDENGNPKVEIAKAMTVNNKGELKLYQIPVVSVQDLPFDEYTVTLWVNKAVDSNYDFLDRGGEFYFDAVRIYDPCFGKDDYVAYRADREAYNYIKEIRNILLSKDAFESINDTGSTATVNQEGVVFIDVNSTNVDPITGKVTNGSTTYTTTDVNTYDKIGPKNEVYLAPGQAVAFNLQVSTIQPIASLDIGAKTIVSCSPTMEIGILGVDASGKYDIRTRKAFTVQSATAQYWEINIDGVQVKSGGNYQPLYLVIYNTSPENTDTTADAVSQNVISLTDVKVAYKGAPAAAEDLPQDGIGDTELQKPETETPVAPAQFLVSGDTLPAARVFVGAVMRTMALETPVLDQGARIMHSLNLTSDISINYVIAKTELADYDRFYMECYIPGRELPVSLQPVEKGNYYYFTLEGMTAPQIGDVVEATLFVEKDGILYRSGTDRYSIAQYAYAQLEKNNVPTKLHQLCAELLRYGSAAQVYKNYHTDSLADAKLTEEQKALLTDLSTLTFGNTNRELQDLSAPTVSWVGKALILDSKVTLRYVVDISGYSGKVEDLSLRIAYTSIDGTQTVATLTDIAKYGTVEGR
ncbi:MAG: hypothetical protein IKM59_08140, partial [Oscillospiraceae bacterium]|nr:hypothetical protein [Oscillospiraceae bacterium]